MENTNMGIFLIWLCRTCAILFWICDILNMPFMTIFDTTYPLNEEFYLLVYIFIGCFMDELTEFLSRGDKK